MKIYGLICPKSKQIRYIGVTRNSLDKRLKEHLRENKSKTHKQKWIKSLVKSGLKPDIILICLADESNWIELERFYIKLFKSNGLKLTNTSEGGEGGGNKGYRHTEEWKAKASERMVIRNKENPLSKEFYEELNGLKRKKVTRIGFDGSRKNYDSINEAAKELCELQKNKSIKQTATNISNCLNKRAKTAWGYMWDYLN
jgi:group I intron endonuclease